MRQKKVWIIYLLMVVYFSKAKLEVRYYQRQFKLSFFGSLTSEYNVLFSGEGNTFAAAINQCSEFCRNDIRCIGMELCKVRDDLYRCRACCETITLDDEISYNYNDACRYLDMPACTKVNIAVHQPASMSSALRLEQQASNAVDNITTCPTGRFTAHTRSEYRPWIKIDLQTVFDVNRVIIYNRQDAFGYKLHDLQINVGMNGTENTCGIFKGPAKNGDRIVVFCTALARGSYVILTILSLPEETDILHICEIQIFANN